MEQLILQKKQLNFLSSGVASGFGILVVSDIKGNVIALNQNDGSEIWSTNVVIWR